MGSIGFGKPVFWAGLAVGVIIGVAGYFGTQKCVQRCKAKKAQQAKVEKSLDELLAEKKELERLIAAQEEA